LPPSPNTLLGAEHPRVELRPPAAYSLGGEATELARLAGLVQEPWQVDGTALMLSVRRNGLWACFEYAELLARQNGKTFGLFAPRALAGLFLLEERLIMWSAHEYKTAIESFLQVRDLIRNLSEAGLIPPVKVNQTNGEEGFLIPSTGQRLKFLARSKGSGRGFTGDCNLIDEAFAYTRAQQSALMPTTSARPNAQICYASSPPLDSDSGEVLFALRKRAEDGDAGLGWRDWGLPGDLDELERMSADERAAVLDDRDNWAATNPALGRGRMTEETIARNRRAMDDIDFARECLGIWPVAPELGGRVIRAADWDRLADSESTFEGTPVFAIDCSPGGKWAAIAAAGRRADGVPHVEIVEHRGGTGWLVERARELHEKYEPGAWLLDPGGPAGAVVVELEGAGLPLRFVTGREYAGACGAFLAEVTDASRVGLRHLGDPVLDAAVSAGRRRDVGDGGWAWGRKNSEVNIAPLVAVTLAHHIAAATADPLDNIW
jgi:hypothetical protein